MDTALSVQDLTVSYDKNTNLHNINFEIKQEKQIDVIGLNGVGKSALMKAVQDLITKGQGTIEFYRKSVKKLRNDKDKNVIVILHDLSKAGGHFDYLILINRKLIKVEPDRIGLDTGNVGKPFQSNLPFLQPGKKGE